MTAEGWDARSIPDHVQDAKSLAQNAYDLAQANDEKLDELIAEVGLVNEGNAKILEALETQARQHSKNQGQEQIAEVAEARRRDAQDMERGALFTKVKRIKSEIGRWWHFLTEVQCVRAAMREWQALDENAGRRHD